MGKSCIIVAFMLLVMIHSSLSLMKCKRHELEALLKFKLSFTEGPMDRLSSWVGDDCCHWLGVTCDNITGNVIKLNLQSESPYEGDMVSSGLSPALLELKFLTHLDLSWNNFNGRQIPEFIGSMSNLRYLNLSNTGFSGQIPPQLGNLKNLIHLDLSYAFDGSMSQERLEWASGLSKLQYLNLEGINMSKTNEAIQVLIRLPSLLVLDLSGCALQNTHLPNVLLTNISSTMPSSSTLQHLDLSDNIFEGPFPSFLKHMLSLQSLSLGTNGFNCSVPLWLRNIRRLEFLDLSENRFTNVEGGMWGIMGNPCNFKHLDLSHNLINQDDMLQPFSNSSRCTAYDLEHLGLGSNELNGSLSSLLGQLTKLQYLDLSHNGFQGPIHESIAKLSALKVLDLSNNRLSGLMPDVLGNLTELESLYISYNSIHGTVSRISNLSKLSYLDMSFNNLNLTASFNCRLRFQLQYLNLRSCGINMMFPQWLRNQTQLQLLDLSNTGISGNLPEWIWNMTYLHQLQLSDNQLTGSLPRHIACDGCTLDVLELYNNTLSGTIPHWLGHLKMTGVLDVSNNWLSGRIFEGENASSLSNSLMVLDLSDNMFSGEIQFKNVCRSAMQFLGLRGNYFSGPISSQLCHFPNLQILELAHNRLTGHIPRCLGSLLFDRGPSYYYVASGVEVQEIIKGVTQKFTGTEWTHSVIDFSSNGLIGTIPEELTNISKLMELNLSNNHLTGGIPGDIGNLHLLESLDLSNNNLSGTIPQSMSAIFGLSILNLSNNHLYGPIPTGKQLQTLDDSSIYAGNSGLCGFPLPNKCTKLDPPPSPTNMDTGVGEEDDVEDKHEKMWLYLVIMSGVATGFWGVVGTLAVKTRWRHAYFRFVEKTADKISLLVKVAEEENQKREF